MNVPSSSDQVNEQWPKRAKTERDKIVTESVAGHFFNNESIQRRTDFNGV